MLTDLDSMLFPDDCEVVAIPSHHRWIYLIQKNGSSSLRDEARAQGWNIYKNQELMALDAIDIYLRDPVARYLSGVNTFVQHLVKDDPSLDRHTCERFATGYLFLNRHYLPQWHWLLNLARHINCNCRLRFHSMDGLAQVTTRRSRADIRPLDTHRTAELWPPDGKLDLWFLMDRILLGRCGQSLTWQEILRIYQEHPAQPLRIVLDRMEAVRHVLC